LGNGLTKKISLPFVTLPEIIMLAEDLSCIYCSDLQVLQGP